MPRRVTFREDDEVYSIGTPSPSLSGSTLSSPELNSPLHLDTQLPPSTSPLFGQFPGSSPVVSVAPQLETSLSVPKPGRLRPFNYDLWRNPDNDPFTPGKSVTRELLERPAVLPPVDSMTIVIRSYIMPLSFDIRPHGHKRGYLTVGDVLWGLYRSLKKPIDLSAIQPQVRQQVLLDFQNRARTLKQKEGSQYEEPSRIDLLAKCHLFSGLSLDAKTGNWELVVEEA
ncbi:hypothetical protein CC1G_07461 [Coprinopsis cinerea okayama7|uniref:DUF6699 domain-containing protein n=1 Tax=Coprinopsis cinerea (strain Okayama-7 / 130 / ATCC MYA-4618 / FGSC 9003) TaxID=240176 RepID=A8NB91_COPC7|nr:hypothetical protein CC1G_07461 [Coprinopsis cinerea okayama7\|eukprot:XP_001832090.1 hypothetical protein CC1G_07461 [Coprinopsis cinerea okayama7\